MVCCGIYAEPVLPDGESIYASPAALLLTVDPKLFIPVTPSRTSGSCGPARRQLETALDQGGSLAVRARVYDDSDRQIALIAADGVSRHIPTWMYAARAVVCFVTCFEQLVPFVDASVNRGKGHYRHTRLVQGRMVSHRTAVPADGTVEEGTKENGREGKPLPPVLTS
jgi:hypothetical protein